MINNVIKKDLDYITNVDFISWDKINGKTFFVTGGTGLIGSTIINALLYKGNCNVIALVRDIDKAKKKIFFDKNIKYIIGNLENFPSFDDRIDYIIHCAMPTSSNYFVNYPVDVVKNGINGTISTLELAKDKKVLGYTFLSSMEVYGLHTTDEPIKETMHLDADSLNVRNSYPLTKTICENLCIDYCSQYNVPAKIVRLSQTFGPGIELNDNRVFAEFIRCVINKQNIVLKTTGESKRCYLYTADAATGILKVLLDGDYGGAYNLANPDTFCSIKDMANFVANTISNNGIKVVFELDNENSRGFMKTHSYNLSIDKIENIGYTYHYSLCDMYSNCINYFK